MRAPHRQGASINDRLDVQCLCIRESVDSLCRDDADMPMPQYIGKACNRPNAAFVKVGAGFPGQTLIYGLALQQ